MQNILSKFIKFTNKNKGILIFLKNQEKIYIKISGDAIPHLLGITKIDYYKNKPSSLIFKWLEKGKITINQIQANPTIPKNIRKEIRNKIASINTIIDNYSKIENIFIYSDIQYKYYFSSFVIKIDNSILCLNTNHHNDNFYNCHLRSIRLVKEGSKEKELYKQCYSEIKEIKWSKK